LSEACWPARHLERGGWVTVPCGLESLSEAIAFDNLKPSVVRRHPIPSMVTAGRYALAVAFICFFASHAAAIMPALLPIAILIEVTDAIDGRLARGSTHIATPSGAVLDSMADSFARISEFLALAWLHLIPFWFIANVFWRDSLVSLVRLLTATSSRGSYVRTPLTGKLKGISQGILLIWLVGHLSLGNGVTAAQPREVTDVLLFVAATATTLSGIEYLLRGRRVVWAAIRYG
jgi:phosphatidylglycerophosphate synthase